MLELFKKECVKMRIFKVASFRNYGFPKKILRPKQTLKTLEVTDTPITSNIRSWYRDAGEKLNDIFLEQTSNKDSTYISGHNKDVYEKLPKVIKDALKPSDVSYNGHIEQSKINELWEAAKKAHEPGVYGYAPIFRGALDESPNVIDEAIPSLEIESSDMDLVSHIGEISQQLENGVEIVSEVINETSEHGLSALEHLTDLLG
jgi:hypothetical protein